MYNLGIDLGGTNVAAGIVDKDFRIVGKCSVPTNAQEGIDCIVDNIRAAAVGAIEDAGVTLDDIESINKLGILNGEAQAFEDQFDDEEINEEKPTVEEKIEEKPPIEEKNEEKPPVEEKKEDAE